jgi:hypothetical protein
MSRPKILFLGSLAFLTLLLGAGCPLLPGVKGLIQLQIDTIAASKGIAASDLEVTGLNIQVRDPEGELLKTIDWVAKQGPRLYLIPVKAPGEHEVEVTHIGERDGDAVQLVDTAIFDVPARKVTVIDVVPGCIAVIRIED